MAVNVSLVLSVLFAGLALPIVLNFIVLARAEKKYQSEEI